MKPYAILMQVIRTELELRGGSEKEQRQGYVARRVVQYWSVDGELLAEVDPAPNPTRSPLDDMMGVK